MVSVSMTLSDLDLDFKAAIFFDDKYSKMLQDRAIVRIEH